jgi:hypothetical protein
MARLAAPSTAVPPHISMPDNVALIPTPSDIGVLSPILRHGRLLSITGA